MDELDRYIAEQGPEFHAALLVAENRTCTECAPLDECDILGECIVCGNLTCEWHGKEYHAMSFDGIAHHACRDYGWED